MSVYFLKIYRLVGLVVNASASGAKDPGFEPAWDGIFPGWVIQVT